MSKKIRDEVYKKYNGCCAYTGKPLDEKWQIDHITPKHYYKFILIEDQNQNDINNLLPTFQIINHYKRGLDLEGFRWYMLDFHLRLTKLPKKTLVERTQKRKEYMFKIAELFDITVDEPFCGTFWFEKQ